MPGCGRAPRSWPREGVEGRRAEVGSTRAPFAAVLDEGGGGARGVGGRRAVVGEREGGGGGVARGRGRGRREWPPGEGADSAGRAGDLGAPWRREAAL